MEKNKIVIPRGISYLGGWSDFSFSMFPSKCIINKQIPGCGFTEYCINGKENIILCSPRKLLLWNKHKQHLDKTYLVINEMEPDLRVDKDISKEYKGLFSVSVETESVDVGSDIYKRIWKEIDGYYLRKESLGEPYKILVTYDSYRIVKSILESQGRFSQFYTIIDEYQSILHDARFKSSTELGFMQYLRTSPTSLFVSATPMMEDYMEMLDEFKDLPYYEFDWSTEDPDRITRPHLQVLTMMSVGSKAKEIINRYLSGKFNSVDLIKDGKVETVYSTEAVFYVNSVNHIISIIKGSNLTPSQCNILCSDTKENRGKLRRKLGKTWTIGDVPVEGEQHKMFTFCTRTVYLGADFYSRCAQSFVFSDSNSDCLSVDISEDLPQILGRQRLSENPWRNEATFYYRSTADYKKMTADDFNRIIEKKRRETSDLLSAYSNCSDPRVRDSLARAYQFIASNRSYKEDYVAVNVNAAGVLTPVVNTLVFINELRSFRIQQIDYKDRFSVFNTIYTNERFVNKTNDEDLHKALRVYSSMSTVRSKLSYLCEGGLKKETLEKLLLLIPDTDIVRRSYEELGPQKIISCQYNRNLIIKALGKSLFNDQDLLANLVFAEFHVGDKIPNDEAKRRLGDLYGKVGYTVKPKAQDLEKYFDLKMIKLSDRVENKRVHGIELLRQKV